MRSEQRFPVVGRRIEAATTKLITALLVSVAILAQTAPDFSGMWRLDPQQSTTSGGGTGGGRGRGNQTGGGVGLGPPPQRLVIKQDAETLSVEERGDSGVSHIQYGLAGQPKVNQVGLGGGGATAAGSYKSAWEGAKLVTTIGLSVGPQSRQLREVRFLRPDGAMVVETTVAGRGGRSTVYVRSSP
jgi:hypothetical protein